MKTPIELKRRPWLPAGLLFLLTLTCGMAAPAAPGGDPLGMGQAEEEIFELRMERVLKSQGKEALFARLQAEVTQNYRPCAAAWLANYLLYGDQLGLPGRHDESAGMAMERKAMSEGSIFAKEMVGRALVDGRGVAARQPQEGAVLLKEAAEAGRYTAMAELAKLYLHGYGVPRDLKLAELWVRRAAYRGEPGMLFFFGAWMENGKSGWPVNLKQACQYYLEAAEWGNREARLRLVALAKEGNLEARINLHLLLLFDLATGGDFTTVRIKQTVQFLEKERPDDPRVQLAVGQIQMERMLPVFDPAKAWEQLEKAAQQGETDGRYFQAEMLRRGIGRKKNAPAAIAQIQGLADQGNAHAMGRLGWLYYWGANENSQSPKDETKAFEWIRAAAHAGDMFSILNIAFMHNHGIGTPVNYYMSARYYSIAEDVGWREATRQKNAALAAIKD